MLKWKYVFLFLLVSFYCSGIAFVKFRNDEDGLKAIEEMNGKSVDNRQITVQKARRDYGYEKSPGNCKN